MVGTTVRFTHAAGIMRHDDCGRVRITRHDGKVLMDEQSPERSD